MDGLNAKFISNPPGFVEYNILTVVSPADTRFQGQNARLGVHDMDLVKSPLTPVGSVPGAVDLSFYQAPVQPAPQNALGQVGTAISSMFSSSTPKHITGDGRLRAYWLPWAPDTIAEIDLVDPSVQFFFTAGFSGCSFTVSGNSMSPHVCHSNMVNSTNTPLPNVREIRGQLTMHNKSNNLTPFEIPDTYGTQVGGRQHTKAIGQNLANARYAANMTQITFAAASGMTVEGVGQAENGAYGINVMNAIADTYAGVLNVPSGPLKTVGPLTRVLTREEKYKRVYLGQELKARYQETTTGVANDVFAVMSFDHNYGFGQDDAHGRSAQASVCGYRTNNGNWRFISQYHIVNVVAVPQTISIVSCQCVVCRNSPQRCGCPG